LIIVLACVIAGAAFAAGRDAVVYITKTGKNTIPSDVPA
jgi:peroxiredoxin family protein